MLLPIDELNTFDAEAYIRQFFKPMPISEERMKEREETAKDFREVLLFLFALITVYGNDPDWQRIEYDFRIEFERVVLLHIAASDRVEGYIDEKVSDFIRVTKDFIARNDEYATSDKRATMEAVNEANTVVGLKELQQAKEDGYTYKIWQTEADERVRQTHREVEGVKIPIDEMFFVGDGLMEYPHDWYHNPDECYNCRCALEFE